jgi:hypothetical protein
VGIIVTAILPMLSITRKSLKPVFVSRSTGPAYWVML